ncbi:hypothetical protein AW168_31750 [Nocardia brasiliensis]|nr:hypothetical protein AW168_31750 [Nocardia brasiliensis]
MALIEFGTYSVAVATRRISAASRSKSRSVARSRIASGERRGLDQAVQRGAAEPDTVSRGRDRSGRPGAIPW